MKIISVKFAVQMGLIPVYPSSSHFQLLAVDVSGPSTTANTIPGFYQQDIGSSVLTKISCRD